MFHTVDRLCEKWLHYITSLEDKDLYKMPHLKNLLIRSDTVDCPIFLREIFVWMDTSLDVLAKRYF